MRIRPSLVSAAAVFTASVAVTLLFLAVLPSGTRINESSDYRRSYEPVARRILAGRGVTTPNGSLALRYPPGYPALLAGYFALAQAIGIPEAAVLRAAALASMGAASVLLFLIARTIWPLPPALLAPALWMTYPIGLWFAKQPNSELPFLVALFATVLLFLEARRAGARGRLLDFGCGVGAGLAMLIRPIAIGLGVLLALLAWLERGREHKRRVSAAGLLLLGNAIAILPWEAYVYARTGRVVLLSTGGVPTIRDGLTFAQHTAGLPAGVASLARDLRGRYPEMRSFGGVASVLAGEFAERPAAVIHLFAVKIARSWYGTESRRQEGRILAIQSLYLGLVAWSAVAAWRRRGRARRLTFQIVTVVLYFWAMTVVGLSILRYMVPAVGLLFALTPVLAVGRAGREGGGRPGQPSS